jgi:tetratricopeptide (TPR) repeat protein
VAAPATAAPEVESGLVFRDQRPLSLKSGKSEETSAVTLCNASGAAAAALRWSLGGFHFTDGDREVSDAAVLSLAGARKKLAAGACASANVTVKANPAIDPGPFSGVLTVTSAGDGVARLDVAVAGPAGSVVPTEGAAATIELTATRRLLFSDSVSIDGDSALALKAPPQGKSLELAKEGAFIGNLVNGGDLAAVFVSGEPEKKDAEGVWLLPIEVRGAAHSGQYEGTLSPTASGDAKQTVKAKVAVTDWWPWAVLAILIGAGVVVLGPTLYIRRWKLESELHDRHRALVAAYDVAGACFHQHSPRFDHIGPPSKGEIEGYASAVDDAIRAYAESTWYFDTTSDAYKKIVESLDGAEADAECLQTADGLGKALGDLNQALDHLAEELGIHLPIERRPAIALAAAALLQRGRLAVGEATIRARKAHEALDAIECWTALAQELRRAEVWYRVLQELSVPDRGRNFSPEDLATLQEIYAALGEARHELLEATDAKAIHRLKIKERLGRVYDRLARLGSSYNVWVISEPAPPGEEDDWPRLSLEIDGKSEPIPGGVKQRIAAVQEQLPASFSDAQSWRKNADTLKASAAKPVELGRTKRFIADAMVVLLSVATGTIAALSAFYFGKTFGTTADYLTVIFVGTAAQAFLKPVSDTLSKLRGDTGAPVTKSDPEQAAATTIAKVAGQVADNH